MDVPTRKEFDKALEALWQKIKDQDQEINLLKGSLPDWVPLEDAMRLTGRSRSWFYEQREMYKLPIAMLPRTKGSRRNMYSRADCVTYGRSRAILPPIS